MTEDFSIVKTGNDFNVIKTVPPYMKTQEELEDEYFAKFIKQGMTPADAILRAAIDAQIIFDVVKTAK